jgi:hypothetical protein
VSNLWDEIDQALWYKDNTIVVTKICTLANDIGKVVCDILKSLLLCSNLQQKTKMVFVK